MATKNGGTLWTKGDVKMLKSMLKKERWSFKRIARTLKRTEMAVFKKATALGLREPVSRFRFKRLHFKEDRPGLTTSGADFPLKSFEGKSADEAVTRATKLSPTTMDHQLITVSTEEGGENGEETDAGQGGVVTPADQDV